MLRFGRLYRYLISDLIWGLQPFKDPVVAADGFTYERIAIEEWLEKQPVSPVTNIPLKHTQLVQNKALFSLMNSWREADMDIISRVLEVEDCLRGVATS